MRIARLADLFDHKYGITSLAGVFDRDFVTIKKDLRNFYETWLTGNSAKQIAVPDQSVLEWASLGTGVEFDQIKSLLDLVKDLAINPSLSEIATYVKLKEALAISQLLKDQTIEKIKEALLRSTRGLRKADINKLNFRATKIRTFLRMLDSAYDSAQEELGAKISVSDKMKIRKSIQDKLTGTLGGYAGEGGYEDQKPEPLTEKQIHDFTRHPVAQRYRLDSADLLSKLLLIPGLRPEVERMIRSSTRGHDPANISNIESRAKAIREYLDSQKTQEGFFELPEGEAKEYMDLPRQQEEKEDKQREWQALTPAQQWSRQMQEAKQQLALEQQEQPPILSKEQLEEQVEKRDLEHQKREEALISKYNGLTFEQWMRK